MAPMSQKKRKIEDGMRGKVTKPRKRIRKQKEYHSSSEDEDGLDNGFAPVNLAGSDNEIDAKDIATKSNMTPIGERRPVQKQAVVEQQAPVESDVSEDESDATGAGMDDEDDEDDSADDATTKRKTSKRNDPEAFSTSMSKILSTKLPKAARKDPVLSRSREAAEESTKIANERLEQRAKTKLRTDKKEDLQRGRIKDVLGLSSGQTGQIAEEEKRLRKVAQRGVVKLFNAVRTAQVRAEQAAREERKKGTVGMANREEKVNEMSKQGFLELITGKKETAEVS